MCDINPVIKTSLYNIMLRKLNINSQREVYINLFIRTNSSEIGFIQLLETLVCYVEGPFVCVPALCMFLTPNKSLSSMADFVCCCLLCFIFFCCYLLSSKVFSLFVLSLAEKMNPVSLASNMFRTSSQDCFWESPTHQNAISLIWYTPRIHSHQMPILAFDLNH